MKSECKACHATRARQWAARPEIKDRAWERRQTDEFKARRKVWKRTFERNHRAHKRCWNRYEDALERGYLRRGPCEVCGDVETHGHHDDYSKPLSVRWLCVKHHAIHHRKYPDKQPAPAAI